MISVEEALRKITQDAPLMPIEQVGLNQGLGRVLGQDIRSRRTQPPVGVSAMDGYAVRAADVATVPVTLTQIGAAAAGRRFDGIVGPGQTARIFTGAPVPEGADSIVIQENTEAEADKILIKESVAAGTYIRPAGLDFRAGEVGLEAGRELGAREIGLAAAMDIPWLPVRRQPHVALLATGDEIVLPGEPVGPDQIVSSSGPGLTAFVTECGGRASNLGVAADTLESLSDHAAGARGADILVTIGGASVGDHDLVRDALEARGMSVDFWRIAMRPGKPLMFGRLGDTMVLGLPGNPVSSMVCALLFLEPLIARMLGRVDHTVPRLTVALGADIDENDQRQDYLRARLTRDANGGLVATPFSAQDSSMLSGLVRADCLLIRAPFAPAARAGDPAEAIMLTSRLG